MAEADPKPQSRRPPDGAFRQQKLIAWQPILTPWKVIAIFFAIGIAFVPTGTFLMSSSNDIFESTVQYDGPGSTVSCSISSQNQAKQCLITFILDKAVTGPLYVYYQLGNYYQNHRIYVYSRNAAQLQGKTDVTAATLETSCGTKTKNGTYTLNPCGLIANSFFTDVFTMTSSSAVNAALDETGISWLSDREAKFLQVNGFKSAVVSNTSVSCASVGLPNTCKNFYDGDTGTYYKFYYPDDNNVQYLYETYPGLISPIEGVTNEHFIVWMRTAALPTFRKLYGKISGNFPSGTTFTIQVTANYEVNSFGGSKSLTISNVGEFGGKNPYLGTAYVVVGSLCLFFGFLFAVKHVLSPRPLGDPNLLSWS